MKKTFLHEQQLKVNAKMVPFAGWSMPVSYKGILEEHKAVREKVGIFDVSHMGEVIVYGKDALVFLQKICPQNISRLALGGAIYCQLTNNEGGIIDDFITYKIEQENEENPAKYLLIMNASRVDEDINWLSRNSLGFDVVIDNQTHNYSLLAIQGPFASSLIEKMGVKKEDQPNYFSIKRVQLDTVSVYLARTGYTGEDGFEVLVRNQFSEFLWHEFLENGKEFGIEPIGLGARDTLRLEAGLHLYGQDMDEGTTPVEAGLSWSISKNKEEDYNGREIILSQLGLKNKNLYPKKKQFIAFEMVDKAIARHECEIYFEDKQVGIVTSGSFSPTTGKNIGLGYIDFEKSSLTSLNKNPVTCGTTIQIMVRNKLYNAVVVKRPFVKKNVKI
ncbi:MAG: glycine cleavage system aminomethyltransferase GcvT [Cyanobacteria bacterium SIG30]|nr:glycine cleavage system aminomethyltransferase GcvT [Cyanobacteria bacterium SIG30]